MAEQRFVNLMGTGNVIGREKGLLSKIVIDKDVTPNTPIRIFPDYMRMEIRVVREENFVEDSQFLNPFDDWVVNSENNELVVWVATPRMGMVSTIKNVLKVIRVDGGMLVAVLKGKIAVENQDGEQIEIQRWYSGSAKVDVMDSAEDFQPFEMRKVEKGFELPWYGWNVLFDLSMKKHVYGERNGFRYEETKIEGIDFRPTDFHKLDADIYAEQVTQYLEMQELEKERKEQLLVERLKKDEKWVLRRKQREQEEALAKEKEEQEKKARQRSKTSGKSAEWSEQSKELLEKMGIIV